MDNPLHRSELPVEASALDGCVNFPLVPAWICRDRSPRRDGTVSRRDGWRSLGDLRYLLNSTGLTYLNVEGSPGARRGVYPIAGAYRAAWWCASWLMALTHRDYHPPWLMPLAGHWLATAAEDSAHRPTARAANGYGCPLLRAYFQQRRLTAAPAALDQPAPVPDPGNGGRHAALCCL